MSLDTTHSLALDDIQKILAVGYGEFDHACYFLISELYNVDRARAYFRAITEGMIDAASNKTRAGAEERKATIAFSFNGLQTLLDCPEDDLHRFDTAFREGMSGQHNLRRARILGDTNPGSTRKGWDWGRNNEIQILLILYARTEADSQNLDKTEVPKIEKFAKTVKVEYGYLGEDGKEHFGFRDGIAQPSVEGLRIPRVPESIKPGEFILGYANESGAIDDIPGIPGDDTWGKNGSYLVFRKLEQDVKTFEGLFKGKENPELLKAKMVGRWQDGSPLTLAPEGNERRLEQSNDFNYHKFDQHGYRCPIGAHIRRANPRDSLLKGTRDKSPAAALSNANSHRIIRRGRLYQKGTGEAAKKGLLFVCFNASIEDQFEFIQRQWVNNKKFSKLTNEVDPLIGAGGKFTIQAPYAPKQVDIKELVTTKAGAYFFLPGICALKQLLKP